MIWDRRKEHAQCTAIEMKNERKMKLHIFPWLSCWKSRSAAAVVVVVVVFVVVGPCQEVEWVQCGISYVSRFEIAPTVVLRTDLFPFLRVRATEKRCACFVLPLARATTYHTIILTVITAEKKLKQKNGTSYYASTTVTCKGSLNCSTMGAVKK